MNNQQAVFFSNKEGLNLFGILHSPEKEKDKNICILLLSPGVKMRVAPHRLYNRMSSQLVSLGFTVFRFDFCGLGDSEGEVQEKMLADFYTTVQKGRYSDDTLAAMDWVQNEKKIDRFILSGLCGGAITGLLAGARDDRVEALLGLGIPVILDGANTDHNKHMTSGQVNRMKGGYFRKLLNFKSWVRLLTFKSNYSVIAKVIKQIILSNKKPIDNSNPDNKKLSENNFNPYFSPAFFEWMKNSKKIFFIFSGADRLTWEFDEKFAVPEQQKLIQYKHLYQVYTVPEANHIFTFTEWYDEMMKQINLWLEENY